ncbi:hypothetical protein Ping_1457 [Psychromonas ingrahamii 37]|uniref:Uncharacterized protein n=1 Tax=Psychromonas ingrahamii (strain DSM 17664 / CCUG 51855 / 37) TaxID=357804 RepID=A1SUV9_PSYIN|nr:hypothetical protein [Psychromonas ingrahamii]ABM03274.1 hypothetical protein Ping_1457 [Psychromonas ingrahamii 37]
MNKIFEVNMIELMVGGLLIFLLSVWIGKVWNNKVLRKKKAQVDDYIKTLNAKHAEQVASLENELKVDRHSLRLTQTQLIEKRIAVIDQCYKYFADFDQAIDEVKSSEKTFSPQENYDLALLRFTAFVSFFDRNRVYFSAWTATKVSKSHASSAATLDLMKALIYADETLSNTTNEELQSLFNKLNSDVNRIRQEIESEMRAILQIDQTIYDDDQDSDQDSALPALSIFH